MQYHIIALMAVCSLMLQRSEAQTQLDQAFSTVTNDGTSPVPSNIVINKSFTTPNGERVLRLDLVVDTSLEAVWKLFTDPEQITTWEVAQVKLDLRMGGSMMTHYKKDATLGGPGTITLGIINYLPMEMITYKVTLTDVFPEKCRNEDDNLQEVLQFKKLAENKTLITSSMLGWETGPEWDDVYNKFDKGNTWTYQQLVKRLHEGPRAWK